MSPCLMQVTIDPGLEGRRPTPWARTLCVHDFKSMPGEAIPTIYTVSASIRGIPVWCNVCCNYWYTTHLQHFRSPASLSASFCGRGNLLYNTFMIKDARHCVCLHVHSIKRRMQKRERGE